jgi:hypothetical protein
MRSFILLSMLILASGFASCFYGSLYERNLSAPSGSPGPAATDTRAAPEGKGDTFYISDDYPDDTNGWQILGVVLMLCSLCILTTAAIVWVTEKSRGGGHDSSEILKLR